MPKIIYPALQHTTDFFELYQYICGISEIPSEYHFWSSLSIVAALAEDHIWFEKFKGEKLYPNLYMILVGPSGLGKGGAISQAIRVADSAVYVNRYRGKLTYAHLIDKLGKASKDEWGRLVIANPRLFLVADELRNSVGTNQQLVTELIALLTELYTASGYTLQTGTRTHGSIDITNPVVNCLFGSTEDWLRFVITKDIAQSGFTARTCFVFGKYDFEKKCPRIIYPDDYEEVYEHIKWRLWMMQNIRGRCVMTSKAEALEDEWYITRPNPSEEALYSTWKRNHDLMLKFAMLMSLADKGDLVICHRHLKNAKDMVDVVNGHTMKLIEMANETWETKPSNDIIDYIKEKGTVKHSDALRYFRTKKGMNASRFKAAVWDLKQEGLVEFGKSKTGGVVYTLAMRGRF
jgi:hypothetical protein